MPTLPSFNPFAGKQEAVATERLQDTASTSIEPSAPSLEGVVTEASKNNFEWNLGRLYSDQEGHSALRTWTVRILSTLLVFPVVLTAIVDIGRRIAFSFGKVDGKSWSLIDQVTGNCKVVADKVNAAYKAYNTKKPLTLEELNEKSAKAIKAQAKNLVNGYKGLNGGFFGNSSFSSPAALKGEREIAKAQQDLIHEIKMYADRNATGSDDFVRHIETAQTLAKQEIVAAAKDAPYIMNKVVRVGPPRLLAEVALKEFAQVQEEAKQYANSFVYFAKQEPQFINRLVDGLNIGILTEAQAKNAVALQADTSYRKGLETGINAARREVEKVLSGAVDGEIITEEESELISNQIQPTIEMLAHAAAKDVVRKQNGAATQEGVRTETAEGESTEVSPSQILEPSDLQVKLQLIQIADALQEEKKLKPENVTEFLTTAVMDLAKAKEAVEAEAFKAREETEQLEAQKAAEALKAKEAAEILEAQRAAEAQNAANQASLLGKFMNLLALISKKQEEQRAQFTTLDALDERSQTLTARSEELRATKVRVQGREMTLLDASGKYYAARDAIYSSKEDPQTKQNKVEALEAQDFGRQTIDMIKELEDLGPQLRAVLDQQVALSKQIKKRHEELATLNGQYKVYKKHNLGQLDADNRKGVLQTEQTVKATQKMLDQRHSNLISGGLGLVARLKQEPIRVVVNIDPEGNRAEVEALVEAFEKSQAAPQEETEIPAYSYRQAIFSGLTYPVRAVRSLWNRSQ